MYVRKHLKTNHFQGDPKLQQDVWILQSIMDTLTSPITLLPIRIINIHVSGKTKVGNFANHSLGKHRCVVSFSEHFKKLPQLVISISFIFWGWPKSGSNQGQLQRSTSLVKSIVSILENKTKSLVNLIRFSNGYQKMYCFK